MMAVSYTTDQSSWLNKDLLTQTQKNSVDLDLSSQLARLLRDRTGYEQTNQQAMSQAQRNAQDSYRQTAESYAARGLSSSTPYIQADDRAFQTAQTGFNDIRQQLSDYLNNYDAATADARLKAEQQKRSIEADALQRYAQKYLNGIGG
jgi:hypothetical protein